MPKEKGLHTQTAKNYLAGNIHDQLVQAYESVREQTNRLYLCLEPEDCVVQTMQCVSPIKWHAAHTSWFFEQFLLLPYLKNYIAYNEQYLFLFNSYYNAIGPQHCQASRGYLSRPTVNEVTAYRGHVDNYIKKLIKTASKNNIAEILSLLIVGINHEQQHQELILTDIKHIFSSNPLLPAFPDIKGTDTKTLESQQDTQWIRITDGVYKIGHSHPSALRQDAITKTSDQTNKLNNQSIRAMLNRGFCFDNEKPRHKVYLHDASIASRLVTNGEYLAFVEADGYENPEYWLSLGWQWVQAEKYEKPLYWFKENDRWYQYTLMGKRELDINEPVCHVNYFEADAFARWAGYRLPREEEWELVCDNMPIEGNFLENRTYHPSKNMANHMYGNLWEWTSSPYAPYPGYQPADGALGEYNGKFMCNQMVLRGGSCATPRDHIRKTYRNFWALETRWQFTGIRLAKDH
ncbi:ergothioneine biosynthesis protein EgtB [Poriferisphaera corsica]|uniref:ergothioneine biosynthesis protein EgtB n=1 Tax=Poriferisphaera corsica TaxID=2528020 RepID=UPI00190C15B1|nr:ergothioneine biosynthesis protein EgtB [Poriferisphaera corsica]